MYKFNYFIRLYLAYFIDICYNFNKFFYTLVKIIFIGGHKNKFLAYRSSIRHLLDLLYSNSYQLSYYKKNFYSVQ